DGIRDYKVTGVQTCALPIWAHVTNLDGKLERLEAMLDHFVQLYFVHTPEVAQDLHAGAVASANRRYFNYRQALSERFPEDDADRSEERRVGKQGRCEWSAGR